MRVLIVTTEWPAYENDITGIHVVNQVNRLRELGIDISVFKFRGCKNPLNYLKAIINFRRLNLDEFSVIHAHHGQAGIVALSQTKIPVVVTFHGSDLQGIFNKRGQVTLLGRVLRFISRLVAKHATEIIIVSDHLKLYLPSRKYHVIPAGIDTILFSPMQLIKARKVLELPLDKRLILFVGDPSRTEKRFWLARASIENLENQSEIQLVLAHGVLHEKMPLYMNACDVLVITSSSEGSPTVVKEALACNLPIVSVDVGDVRQRISEVKGCILCHDSRVETISNALQHVLEQSIRIDGHGSIKNLDERLLIKSVIDVYSSVAKLI